MLELKKLHWKLPDGGDIVNGVDLTVSHGKMTVITGPNGGGKTSIAKLIAGLETPTSGSLWLDGENITQMDITQRAQKGIAYAFQQPVRFKGLKVRDLLELSAGGAIEEDKMCAVLGQVGLCAKEYIDRAIDGSLSGGESKRIEIATVLARKDAKVLVFDEPEAGIDLWSFSSLIDAFKRIKEEQNGALLIISHQERILEIADEIVVIAEGKVRVAGNREDILPSLLAEDKESRCPLGKEKV